MNAAAVYAADKRTATLCTDMQRTGFAFDAGAARQLSEALRELEARARDAADKAVTDAGGEPIARTKTGGFGTKSLAHAFRHTLRAPVYFRSDITGNPSYGVDTLRAYSACADSRLRALSLAILEWRRARKVRATYVDGAPVSEITGRVHPTWLNYGTVSGRMSCQAPNLMNLPRSENDPTCNAALMASLGLAEPPCGVRGLYRAKRGHVIVGFDKKQLEMRVAAYASGDEAMIAACESKDLHAWNAEVIWGEAFTGADPATRKALRSLAKSAAFAVCYMAEAATVYARLVAAGENVKLTQVEAMLRRMRKGFAEYYRWQDRKLHECIRTGVAISPILGRTRWLGHDPSPTECANFPIQSGAADIMNDQLPALVDDLALRVPRARLIAQVHDAGYFEVPAAEADAVVERMHAVLERPVVIASSGRSLEAVFPIDVEVSERWH